MAFYWSCKTLFLDSQEIYLQQIVQRCCLMKIISFACFCRCLCQQATMQLATLKQRVTMCWTSSGERPVPTLTSPKSSTFLRNRNEVTYCKSLSHNQKSLHYHIYETSVNLQSAQCDVKYIRSLTWL